MPTQQAITPRQSVLIMQIIWAALVMGVLTYLVFILFLFEAQPPRQPKLAYVGLIYAGVMVLVQLMVRLPVKPSRVPESHRNEHFDSRAEAVFMAIAPIYQIELIIKLALLEGAAFLNGVAYQTERQWWSLASAGVLLTLMIAKFPTASGVGNWIERRTDEFRFSHFEN